MGTFGQMTTVAAVHGVLPPHSYPQQQLTDLFVALCMPGASPSSSGAARRVHGNAGVRRRHLALPLERYAELNDFTAANDAFIDAAVDIGCRGGDRRAAAGRTAPGSG